MDHETFKETFTEIGFHVKEQEPPEGEERGTVLAENDNGDELWWSVIDPPEVWGIHIFLDRATLDDTAFQWDELSVEDDEVVIEDATGTRSKNVGYGVTGFDGTVAIDQHGATIAETYRHEG
jgi:hypothetical protein